MPSGSDIPRRARGDVLRDQYDVNRHDRNAANTRVEIRAELRESTEEEEDTGVIDQRMLELRHRRELPTVPETPIPEKPTAWHVALAALRRVPPWGIVLVSLAAIIAWTVLRLRGVVP